MLPRDEYGWGTPTPMRASSPIWRLWSYVLGHMQDQAQLTPTSIGFFCPQPKPLLSSDSMEGQHEQIPLIDLPGPALWSFWSSLCPSDRFALFQTCRTARDRVLGSCLRSLGFTVSGFECLGSLGLLQAALSSKQPLVKLFMRAAVGTDPQDACQELLADLLHAGADCAAHGDTWWRAAAGLRELDLQVGAQLCWLDLI